MRPSCGERFSAMSSSAMILMREISPEIRWRGTVVESNTTPSTRKRTRMSWSLGSKWTSDTPRRTASAITACTSFTIGASSADSRSSITSASYVSSSTSLTEAERVPICSSSASMCSGEATARRTS